MLDNESVVAMIKESFKQDTQAIHVSSKHSPSAIRSRLARRRLSRGIIGVGVAGAMAIAIFTLGTTTSGPSASFKTIHLSNYTFKVRSDVATSTTCLTAPDNWVAGSSVASARVTVSSFLRLNRPDGSLRTGANGQACIGAVLTYTTQVPAPIDTVTSPGLPTVKLAPSTDDARVAYIALDAGDSAAAARVTGGPAGVPYYVIGEVPSDNAQDVLVAIFQQGDMAQLLSIHD
ncbi:MAG: hypothetical protein ABI429_08330 [Jatrophihabitantaceae bacterium]